jgi:hypothetical protein
VLPASWEIALFIRFTLCAVFAATVAVCSPDYSPNTHATNAVQQANKVDQGVTVGVREVGVSASGTAGASVGGAARIASRRWPLAGSWLNRPICRYHQAR